jgi:hypothetical protein
LSGAQPFEEGKRYGSVPGWARILATVIEEIYMFERQQRIQRRIQDRIIMAFMGKPVARPAPDCSVC